MLGLMSKAYAPLVPLLFSILSKMLISLYNYLKMLGCPKRVLNEYMDNPEFRYWVLYYVCSTRDKDYIPRIEKEAVKRR